MPALHIVRHISAAFVLGISAALLLRIGPKLRRLLYHQRLATAADSNTAGRHLNEVLFTCRRSTCCTAEAGLAPGCTNPYCMARNEQRMSGLINAARRTVSLSMYFFTCRRLGDAVIAAHQRGVRVRVIGDKSMAYSKMSQLMRMSQLAIPVRFPTDTESLVHHKFCLIDADPVVDQPPASALPSTGATNAGSASQRRPSKVARVLGSAVGASELPVGGVLMNGSMNWTMQALSGNWENVVITSEPLLVRPFVEEFDKMWKEFELNRSWTMPKPEAARDSPVVPV